MKVILRKIVFVSVLAVLTTIVSCKKDDTPTISGETVSSEVADLTCDSFTLKADFVLDCQDEQAICASGIFIGDKSGDYTECVGLEEMTGGIRTLSYTFENVTEDNSRIFPVGSKVYFRPFISVSIPDREVYYIYGEESSFEVPKAKYTIMVYGVGGNNLDYSNLYNLMIPMMKAGCSGNVEIVFQYKMSYVYQVSDPSYAEEVLKLNGTCRWIAPYSGRFLEKWDSSCDALEGLEYIKKGYNTLGEYSEKIGNLGYEMNDPAHLASFLDWSMEKCPAEHYVLLFKDHGNGWDLYEDGLSHAATKSHMSDDNLRFYKTMSLRDVMEGISQSSIPKLECVIFDECLMATVENLSEISQVSSYAIAGQESTLSLQGKSVIDIFNKGVASGLGTYDILCGIVDDYGKSYSDYYTDQGAYNLENIEPFLTASANISAFFKQMYSTEWKPAITAAVTGALRSRRESDEATRKRIMDVKTKIDIWETLSENEKLEVVSEIDKINNSTHFCFCFYDMIAKAVEASEGCAEADQLKNLLSSYNTALRAMAHIDCGKKLSADTPYEYTSPSICLQSLKDGVYEWKMGNFFAYCNYSALSRENAIKNYQATLFDKKTSWSEFLKIIDMSGTLFFNEDRKFRQEGK